MSHAERCPVCQGVGKIYTGIYASAGTQQKTCHLVSEVDTEIATMRIVNNGLQSALQNQMQCVGELKEFNATLKKEISRYSDRDGNAHIELIYPDDNPFNKIDLRICDFGVADNIYVCESDEVMALKEKVKALEATIYSQGRDHTSPCNMGSLCPWCRIAELEAANAKYLEALEKIAYEPIGEAEATHKKVLDDITLIAREAIKED